MMGVQIRRHVLPVRIYGRRMHARQWCVSIALGVRVLGVMRPCASSRAVVVLRPPARQVHSGAACGVSLAHGCRLSCRHGRDEARREVGGELR